MLNAAPQERAPDLAGRANRLCISEVDDGVGIVAEPNADAVVVV